MRVHEFPIDGPLDPFRCHLALRGAGPAVLLDGDRAAGPLARRAYVLFDPVDVVAVPAGSDRAGGGDPWRRLFDRLSAFGARTAAPGEPGGFRAGAAGLLSYDAGRHLERLPATAAPSTRVPDVWFGLFHQGVEIDVATGRGTLFVAETRERERHGARFVDAAVRRATAALAAPPDVPPTRDAGPLASNFTRARYLAAVEAVRESILDGDVYQVNLSQRFEARFAGDPSGLYGRLRTLNPAPFAALVETGDVAVLSSSPERFLARTGRHVETRPIKGTRRRTGDAARDAAAREDLASAEKDGAELAMIVDLQRNDLGRVAAWGSVTVDEPGALEAYATVLHRVAVVSATLAEGRTSEDLLRATFPGGSVTGAPKIAAMKRIEALEALRRGVFTGSVGWIGVDGDLDLNIAIRTMVVEAGTAHFHVGGGIVLDSDPAAEYQETLTKGRALAAALGGSLPEDDAPHADC